MNGPRAWPPELPRKLNFGPPKAAKPAASIVLLQSDRDVGEPRVLMLKRNSEARFMPGAWVFPGGALDPEDGSGESGLETCARRELREEASIDLSPTQELVLFSRWTTPEIVPIRFEASFFLAEGPPGAVVAVDGSEIVAANWFAASEALRAHGNEEMILPFPTIHQLTELSTFTTNNEVFSAYRGKSIAPILPTVVVEGDSATISSNKGDFQT